MISIFNSRSLVFDAASRITAFSHPSAPGLDHAFGYDPADRVNHETDSAGASLWTHDLNGNRLTSQLVNASYCLFFRR